MLTTKLNGVQPNINTFVISEAIASSGALLKQSLTYSIESTGSELCCRGLQQSQMIVGSNPIGGKWNF